MRKIIVLIMFILFIPLVYSLYGGETWSYHFDRCNYLTVNITGTLRIDEGEYTILDNCTKYTMISREYIDILNEGETKKYTIDEKEYEVTIMAITDTGTLYVKFNINGESTRSLKEGDSATLSDGTELGIMNIIPTEMGDVTEDSVKFYLRTHQKSDYWLCDCNDNYDFNVSFKPNAVNNYSFEFDYLYSEETSEDISGSSGGSSGGNRGGAFTIRFLSNYSRTFMLKQGIRSVFWVNGDMHTIMLVWVSNDTVGLEIRSEPIILILKKNEPAEVRIDNETLKMNLEETRGRVAFITFSKIEPVEKAIPMGGPTITPEKQEENITEEEEIIEEPTEEQLEISPEKEPDIKVLLIGAWIMILLGIIAVILYIVWRSRHDKT